MPVHHDDVTVSVAMHSADLREAGPDTLKEASAIASSPISSSASPVKAEPRSSVYKGIALWKILLVVFLLLGLGAGLGYYFYNKKNKQSDASPPPPPPPPAGYTGPVITVDETPAETGTTPGVITVDETPGSSTGSTSQTFKSLGSTTSGVYVDLGDDRASYVNMFVPGAGFDELPQFSSGIDVSSTRSRWDYNYEQVLGMTFEFYEAQRSGRISQAPGGNRITWRGDQLLNDGVTINGKFYDLTGGNYEAGNRLKVTLAQGFYTARLAWQCMYLRAAYEQMSYDGQSMLHWCKREVRWSSEYLLKTHLRADETRRQTTWQSGDKIAVMVGMLPDDWSCRRRAENMPDGNRCTTAGRGVTLGDVRTPAAESAGEASAALAMASALLAEDDPAFAQACMTTAQAFHDFAARYPRRAAENSWAIQQTYPAAHSEQYVLWSAAAIAYASRCTSSRPNCDLGRANAYLSKALDQWESSGMRPRYAFEVSNWDNPVFDAAIALTLATGATFETWGSLLKHFTESYINANGEIYQSGKGLRRHPSQTWASLRVGTFGAHIASTFATLPGVSESLQVKSRCLARSQIGYALGDTGYSYVVCHGANYPRQVHHRDASCTMEEDAVSNNNCYQLFEANRPNRYNTCGAIVGGPNANDKFFDDRADYHYTEVALDYNTGLSLSLAALASFPAEFWSVDCSQHVSYPNW